MKTVLLLSGGIDSSTLLYWLKDQEDDPVPLFIHYGQRHIIEKNSATKIAREAGTPLRFVDLGNLRELLDGSCLTDTNINVPEGHYEDETMKSTVVPNRNSVLLNVAAAYAISIGSRHIAYAAHAGDHAIYPDCRPGFVKAMRELLTHVHYTSIELLTPFVSYSKAQVVQVGDRLGVPFKDTYSCYKGGTTHCGRCGTCVERIEAFKLAGVADETSYAKEVYHE